MRIAFMLGSLNRGGLETLMLDVFRNKSYAKFDFIGIYRKNGAYLNDFIDTKVPFIHCGPQGRCYVSYIIKLRKLLLKERVDIVHAQLSLDCLYAKLACVGTGIKVVETFHGYDYLSSPKVKQMGKLSIHLADAVYFVSHFQKNCYVNQYKLSNKIEKKCRVVYNGIDFSKIDIKTDDLPDFMKNEASGKDGLLRLVMIGNFVSVRNQILVCKSLAVLKQKGFDNFLFYFIGRKDTSVPWMFEKCVDFCKEKGLSNVKFVGGRGDVPSILHNIDGFVYSSASDTFGIAVVEAIAAGIPVLVNDLEIFKEISNNGEIVTLYKTGDEYDLADKVISLLSNISQFKQIAQKSAEKVKHNFSIQAHIDNLEVAYRSV